MIFAGLRQLLELFDDRNRCFVDAALQIHRVHTGSNRLQTFTQYGLSQHRCGRRAITSDVRGMGSDFLDHLRAHVLEFVLQLDFLGHGHAIFGNGRCAIALVEHYIATFGTERHSYRIRQDVHTCKHLVARVVAESNFFSSHLSILLAMIRLSFFK